MSTTTDQQIRFCTSSDGVGIAYATIGSGPPLVKAANWLSHLEVDGKSPVWRHWIRELSRHNTLVRYDERGCGLSDWNVEDFSLEAWVRDLEAVVDALELERFPLLGISQGGPIAIAYATRHPERVSHLILYGSYARGVSHRGLSDQDREERELLLRLIRVGWGKDHPAFRQVFTSLFIPDGTTEQMQWFNELQRVSATPENAARMCAAFCSLDVRALAPRSPGSDPGAARHRRHADSLRRGSPGGLTHPWCSVRADREPEPSHPRVGAGVASFRRGGAELPRHPA